MKIRKMLLPDERLRIGSCVRCANIDEEEMLKRYAERFGACAAPVCRLSGLFEITLPSKSEDDSNGIQRACGIPMRNSQAGESDILWLPDLRICEKTITEMSIEEWTAKESVQEMGSKDVDEPHNEVVAAD